MTISINRGDIVDVDLRGAEGGEKKNDKTVGSRPCVVIQNDKGNRVSPLTIVVPLTDQRQDKKLPVQVQVSANEIQMPGAKDSVVECGHIRTVDRASRILKVRGALHAAALARVDEALAISIGLR